MRFALALLVLLAATPAHAEFVICVGGQGIVPAAGTQLPPHARIVFYRDQAMSGLSKIIAKIDGKPVAVKRKDLTSPPFAISVLEIDSDRTGALSLVLDERAPLTYLVKATAMPKQVTGLAARYQGPTRAGDRSEQFDGLAIRLPEGTPAVMGHVRVRRDPDAVWIEVDTPAYTPAGESRPMLRVGRFECMANVQFEMLRSGFDLEVTVTLSDGTVRAVTGLAPRMTLPEPLPPQPRPKNAPPQ